MASEFRDINPRLAYLDSLLDLWSEGEKGFHKAIEPLLPIDEIVSSQQMTIEPITWEVTYQPPIPINRININLSLED